LLSYTPHTEREFTENNHFIMMWTTTTMDFGRGTNSSSPEALVAYNISIHLGNGYNGAA